MCRMLVNKIEAAVFLADEEKPECLPDIAEMPAFCLPEIISLQLGFLILFLILLSEKLFCFLKPFAVGRFLTDCPCFFRLLITSAAIIFYPVSNVRRGDEACLGVCCGRSKIRLAVLIAFPCRDTRYLAGKGGADERVDLMVYCRLVPELDFLLCRMDIEVDQLGVVVDEKSRIGEASAGKRLAIAVADRLYKGELLNCTVVDIYFYPASVTSAYSRKGCDDSYPEVAEFPFHIDEFLAVECLVLAEDVQDTVEKRAPFRQIGSDGTILDECEMDVLKWHCLAQQHIAAQRSLACRTFQE